MFRWNCQHSPQPRASPLPSPCCYTDKRSGACNSSCRFLAEELYQMGWVQAPESSPAVWSQDSTLPSPNKKKALPHGRPRQNYKPFPIAMDMAEGLRLLAIALGKACAMGVTGTCWASRLVLHSGDGWGTGRKSPSVIHMFNNRKTTLAICTGLHCNTLW